MPTKRKWPTRQYPQSEGNVALADESWVYRNNSKPATPLSPVLGVTQDMTEEASEADGLGPARGIVVGTGLSIVLWCLIVLVIYWIR
jgi:hypothetical protein